MKVKAFDLCTNDFIKEKNARVQSVRVSGGWTSIVLSYDNNKFKLNVIKVRNTKEFEIDDNRHFFNKLVPAVNNMIVLTMSKMIRRMKCTI